MLSKQRKWENRIYFVYNLLCVTPFCFDFYSSLMLACLSGNIDIVKKLRQHGAVWNCTDKGGSSPLHWAVDSDNAELVRIMIEDGVNVSIFTYKTEYIFRL